MRLVIMACASPKNGVIISRRILVNPFVFECLNFYQMRCVKEW